MKKFFLLAILAIGFLNATAQTTKILDAKVDWSKNEVIVYCSDSLATAINVLLSSTSAASGDIFSQSFTVGSNINVVDNTLVIALSSVTPGVYFATVKVTEADGTSIQEMDFKTSN